MARKKRARRKERVSPFIKFQSTESTTTIPAQLLAYSPEYFAENSSLSSDDPSIGPTEDATTWINLHSVDDLFFIKRLGEVFKIETFLLDRIVDLTQRPKVEEHENYKYAAVRTLWINGDNQLETEQISFIIGEDYLISFQEKHADLFEEVRDRIRQNRGIVRQKKAGYLFYLLMEAIVTNYYKALDKTQVYVDELGVEVIQNASCSKLPEIESVKYDLTLIKRNVVPLRDGISSMLMDVEEDFLRGTHKYFSNIKEQLQTINEEAESMRQSLDGLTNIHLTNVNNSMNEVMKLLTIIATIFIPLTFIAGIYGMNFTNMPELNWQYGYFAVLALMVVILLVMFWYFRKRKWF